jgi:predicted flap endonuclease-1-like 5' DNA nuclease
LASGKRIFGTLAFVIAFLAVAALVFILYAKSTDDPNLRDYFDEVNVMAVWVGILLGLIIIVLILLLLIRSSTERARLQAFQEEQDRLAAERDALAAFEASLTEPEKIGWGPDIMVYNLPTIPQMYRAWEKYNRRSNSYTFYYPRSVDAAVYTNNYIPIDDKGTTLKLRTLIAGPPGAQSKDAGMTHQKRPVRLDPKVVAKLDAKWRDSYARQTGEGPPEATTTTTTTTVTSGDGRSAMLQEMEARFTPAGEPQVRAYYDYEGDVHDVEEIEGIGRIYGEKLRAAGVHTTARLCYEDAEDLARRVGVPVRTVEQWKAMSELIKVSGIGKQYAEALARSGVAGITDLKRRSAASIADQVNTYLDSLHTNVLGTKVTEVRVKGWQRSASKMRKVRLKAPEK